MGTPGGPKYPTDTLEPEYLIAALARALDLALEFCEYCGALAPELGTACDDLNAYQLRLFKLTRAAILRGPCGAPATER